jgi:beta-lactamase class A
MIGGMKIIAAHLNIAFVLLFAGESVAQPLQDALRARLADSPGAVSLYAKNLDSGAAVGIRESESVRTASTIKLPILCAVFDAVERGQAKWNDLLTVTAAERVSGTGIIGNEISDGVQLPLRDVAHLMIVLSDNTATNMILERFTADAVNAYLDTIAIRTTALAAQDPGRYERFESTGGMVGSRQTSSDPEVRHRCFYSA